MESERISGSDRRRIVRALAYARTDKGRPASISEVAKRCGCNRQSVDAVLRAFVVYAFDRLSKSQFFEED